ncbi:hypothetical protein EV284_6456 [Streptomyces sp. BK022]|uniref:hypothetical protein n=1 Tax=Streptomyces sp. BK022 TaxID=2512123 RepID=UPI00102969A5|nr:hypothetical protein [Streptomyces sp. BK022]RZU28290.1 hypothetical protein EV284_6456 [Streptomyces sp. BK022]
MSAVAAAMPADCYASLYDEQLVHILLQGNAAEGLTMQAGFPLYPAPAVGRPVEVRWSIPCPACGEGRLSRRWLPTVSERLMVGSDCMRHVFLVVVPDWLRPAWPGSEL